MGAWHKLQNRYGLLKIFVGDLFICFVFILFCLFYFLNILLNCIGRYFIKWFLYGVAFSGGVDEKTFL